MTNEEILNFIQLVQEDQTNTFHKEEIGVILEARDDRGNSYDGWPVFLDNSGIKHIFKNHGNENAEQNRGLIAVTIEDFVLLGERIPEISNLVYEGRDRIGMEILLDKYGRGNIFYYFLFEIRRKRNQLFLKTMYKATY